MLGTYLSLIFAIVLFVSLHSLAGKLQFYSNSSASGRYPYFAGSILLVLAVLWTAARLLPQYPDWFILPAYSFIDIFHLIVVVSGLSLTISGLVRFFDSSNEMQAEIDYRFQKLGILENLQRDAREPYQFLELLNLAIKEIASTIPECSGVIFLTGRNRKQFVLATSIGLTNEETGFLEYFPFDENVVSQAVESGEPLLSGKFHLYDEKENKRDSRFESALVLPMVSGMERIGAIVLLSTVERIFSHQDVRVLAPVGEWLAEKIKSARATRELSAVKKEKDDQFELFNDSTSRILSASKALNSADALNGLANILKGFVESESCHIVQAIDSNLENLAGTEPLLDIGEQFSEAIISTIMRSKISVVNQNAEDEQGRVFTKNSTLVYPLNGKKDHAVLLRRQSVPFVLKTSELKVLSIIAGMIEQAIDKIDNSRFDVTYRLGFDKILQLLRLPPRLSFANDPGFLARHMASILPEESIVLSFTSQNNRLQLVDLFGRVNLNEFELSIRVGEGFIGQTAEKKTAISLSGVNEFDKKLSEFDEISRESLNHIKLNSFTPAYTISTPILVADTAVGVVVFLLKSVPAGERKELERLLTLSAGLYSLRLTVGSVDQLPSKALVSADAARITNAINNNLSVVIGNAEILMTKDGLDNETRSHIQSIMNEAEVAASEVNKLLKDGDVKQASPAKQSELSSLSEIARRSLKQSHVSENLYMVAGRAREIELNLNEIEDFKFPSKETAELFEGAINRFASMADEDDVITVSTYVKDDNLYLDISRHRRNFPPVESVSGFGNYQLPEDALKSRPGDTYLKELAAANGMYAYDRFSTAPSYLSFKFPLKKIPAAISSGSKIEILAVDDQPVILELISAMCQTLGYEVITAGSGAEAMEIAQGRIFNVILTDLAMPGMSGLELAKKLRLRHPDTPIILITGWEATIREQELEESGITDILYKPFRIEQLTNLVKSAATGQSA